MGFVCKKTSQFCVDILCGISPSTRPIINRPSYSIGLNDRCEGGRRRPARFLCGEDNYNHLTLFINSQSSGWLLDYYADRLGSLTIVSQILMQVANWCIEDLPKVSEI